MATQHPSIFDGFAQISAVGAQPLHVLDFPDALVRIETIKEVTGLTGPQVRRLLPEPLKVLGKERWRARVVTEMLRKAGVPQ